MTTTEDARAWARRLVEETLLEAGLVAPSETSQALPEDDGPPPPPSLARQAAHRIVEAVKREHEATAADDVVDAEVDVAEVEPAQTRQAEVASNGHHAARSQDSEAANRARRIVAEVVAAEQAKRDAEAAEEARRAEEAERARRAEEAEEARRAEEAERARRAEEAEEARRAEEAAAQTSELPVTPETTVEMPTQPLAAPELFTEPATEAVLPEEPLQPSETELFTEPRPGADLDFDPDADPGLAFEPEADTEPEPDLPPTLPTASVDLLPAEPTPPPHPGQAEPAPHEHPDEPTAEPSRDQNDAPAPDGPVMEGPPPPPLAMIDGLWQRTQARYRRRRAMAQWAPDAARPPRRTGRWLLVTILAVAAIALLFPLAVDALRQLVAL